MSFSSLICRLCLLESSSSVSMFNSGYDEVRNTYLAHKIMQIANVQIFEGDGLPPLICRPCLCRVEGFFQFKNQIEKSDFFLRQQVCSYQGDTLSSPGLDKHSGEVKSEPISVLKDGVYLSDSLWTENIQTYSSTLSNCGTLPESVTISSPHPQEVVDVLVGNPQPTFVNLSCQANKEAKSLLDLTQQDEKCAKQLCEPHVDFQNSNSSDSVAAEEHEVAVDKPSDSYYVNSFINDNSSINNQSSIQKESELSQLNNSKERNSVENPTDYSVSLEIVKVTPTAGIDSENEDNPNEVEMNSCSNDGKPDLHVSKTNKLVSKDNKFTYCEICDMHFDDAASLVKHKASHPKEPFKCTFCNRIFRQSWSLQSHIRTHTGERPFTCDICNKSFTDRSALNSHQRITHYTEKTHMCSYCGKAFKLKKQLDRHERVHTGHEYHRCEVCGKLFTQKCNLIKHSVLHSGKKPHSCPVCQQSFAQKDNLNIHILRHHSEQNPVVCDVCGKVFKNKMTLMGHKKAKHSENTKQIICEVCGKCFPDKSCLNSHKWVHSKGPIKCDICGKSYPHGRAIRVHKRIVHSEVRKHCCDVCGIGFKTSQTLKHHKVVHTGERAFGCEECGRCFGQRTALKAHMRIHSGVEPYSCPRCSESFKWKQTCDKHVSKCLGKSQRDFVITADDSVS